MNGVGVVFAYSGALSKRTGGTLYDRRIADEFDAAGRNVTHLSLADGFPAPGAADMADAERRLADLPADTPLLIDGLVFGALDTAIVAAIAPPVCALVHHPLALEPGLAEAEIHRLAALEAANLAHAAHVVVTSRHTAATLVRDYRVREDRIHVALPGVDRPELAPMPQNDAPLILSVGLLARRKGHDVLLRALARLGDRPFKMVIVGRDHDGMTGSALRALANDLGLSDRVRFAGELDQSDVADLFAKADIFALATRYEGYGMVFAEALVNGVPIVSCRAGAVPDTVPEAAGLLVPPDDPAAFAEALAAMLDDPARRNAFAQGARSAAQGLPRWSDTASSIGNVIDAIAVAGSGRS